MKRQTVASQKRVNAENLKALGAKRLADILVAAAVGQPELKRHLRMELAAAQGSEHLAVEIDKRLASLETSRSKVSWRQRPSFVRDIEAVRMLIAGRLAQLDPPAALARMWVFIELASQLDRRVQDRDGELGGVFTRAAGDIGRLIADRHHAPAADALVEAMTSQPFAWAAWLPEVLERTPPEFAAAVLQRISDRHGAARSWIALIRRLADVSGDVDAFRATYDTEALSTPSVAAEVAQRLLAVDRVEEAGEVLKAAAPPKFTAGYGRDRVKGNEPDFSWESGWIEYLERSGRSEEAQAVRWRSFERTLCVDRAKAFMSRLPDFDDVEAEGRAHAYASGHRDFQRGLRLLMEWPALPEAARMIQARPDEAGVAVEQAELWALQLQRPPTFSSTGPPSQVGRRCLPPPGVRELQSADPRGGCYAGECIEWCRLKPFHRRSKAGNLRPWTPTSFARSN